MSEVLVDPKTQVQYDPSKPWPVECVILWCREAQIPPLCLAFPKAFPRMSTDVGIVGVCIPTRVYEEIRSEIIPLPRATASRDTALGNLTLPSCNEKLTFF